MKFFSEFFKAIGHCFRAFGVMFEKNLWHFMFYPLIVWILIWVAAIYGLFSLADYLSGWLNEELDIESIPEQGHWLSFAKPYLITKLSFLIGLVLKMLFWFASGTFIKYVMLIIMSPIFALLSERTEEKVSGVSFPFSLKQLVIDILRGIVISLRNMIMEYLFILLGFVITFFFPPAIFFTAPLLLFIGWYFVGFAIIDYSCERHRYGVGKSLRYMRLHKGYACGIGMVYSFFMALPFVPGQIVGMMLGPVISVIGSTTAFLEFEKLESVVTQTAPKNE